MKKCLLTTLSAFVLLSVMMTSVPAKAGTQTFDELQYVISGDEAIITSCNDLESESIIIPKMIDDYTVAEIGDGAFSGCVNIKNITLPPGLHTIADNAFSGCISLKGIEIPESVTYIGKKAFYGCAGIKEIDIPDNITSISDSAFSFCRSLLRVTISEGVTAIGESAFFGCSYLVAVDIPDTVTDIADAAFSGCALTGMPQGINIKNIGAGAFSGCRLTSAIIPDSVENIGNYAFSYNSELIYVKLPESVKSIGTGAFSRCRKLNEISVNAENKNYCSLYGNLFNADKTTLIQYATAATDSSYQIPDGVKRINEMAFSENRYLTSVIIPSSVTEISYRAFDECSGLSDIYYTGSEEDWKQIYIDEENTPFTEANIHFNFTDMPVFGVISNCLYENNTVITTIKFNRIDRDCTVITALYDNQTNKLVKMDLNNASAGTTIVRSEINSLESLPEYKIKVFFWDSAEGMTEIGIPAECTVM